MRHIMTITAGADDIDENGHVNNATWVTWIQEVATAHWNTAASAPDRERYGWVVVRHEIDYRGNITEGESATAETWIGDPARGARLDRHVRFTGPDGRLLVEARTTWVPIERSTGRLARLSPEVTAPFLDRE